MKDAKITPASCCNYELDIEISATRERVWQAIFEEIQQWWLPDFHVAGADSIVTFDSSPGGSGLLEVAPDGNALQWYVVQMVLPAEFKVYLVGNIAPEWGGPSTSNLKLELVASDKGCKLLVVDARHGNVDANSVQSYADGWQQLFTEGLKKYVEAGEV